MSKLWTGEAAPAPLPSSFARIERKWKSGDHVEIKFPMVPRMSRWFNNSIAIERGPLVFSYGIGENWVKLRDRGQTADWQVFPTAPWNYALIVEEASPSKGIAENDTGIAGNPFARKSAPIRLSVRARKVDKWRAEDGAADPLPQSPVESDAPEENITLIPYGAAKLRITAFPQCRS